MNYHKLPTKISVIKVFLYHRLNCNNNNNIKSNNNNNNNSNIYIYMYIYIHITVGQDKTQLLYSTSIKYNSYFSFIPLSYRLYKYIYTYITGYFRLKLSPNSGCCPWWLIFFKDLFYQNVCKEAMSIGGSQIRGALLNFSVVKKCPVLYPLDAALSF